MLGLIQRKLKCFRQHVKVFGVKSVDQRRCQSTLQVLPRSSRLNYQGDLERQTKHTYTCKTKISLSFRLSHPLSHWHIQNTHCVWGAHPLFTLCYTTAKIEFQVPSRFTQYMHCNKMPFGKRCGRWNQMNDSNQQKVPRGRLLHCHFKAVIHQSEHTLGLCPCINTYCKSVF